VTAQAWRWLSEALLLAVHEVQLAEHGGLPGLRDIGLLQSALARAPNRAAYGAADAAALAASYAYGIARNHPFNDGNKRMALLAAEIFLLDNGQELIAPDADIYKAIIDLADGAVDEPAFAAWLRRNIRAAGWAAP